VNNSAVSSLEKWFLGKVYDSLGKPPIRLVLGNEGDIPRHIDKPVATVSISGHRTLAKLVFYPEIGFGDGYADGSIRVNGDLVRTLEIVLRSMKKARGSGWASRMMSRWLDFIQENTLRGSARNIHHHYDLSNDFYKLWLDRQMVYTCAYFPTPSTPLEEAQIAKMDHVCRKIQLEAGERVVEAGCGWGALALHMAKYYGATVRAFNISKEQIAYGRERARLEGLSHKVEFIEDDYRNISGEYDAFVSVGMVEHVGAKHYEELGRIIHRSIGNAGRGLLHFIGRTQQRPFSPWIRKRIFPGAHVPGLREVADILEPSDFSVLDVENLQFHYAKTLEHWLARYEKASDRVTEMFGPEFLRAWRLYLAGSIAAFRVGNLQLFQIVFAGTDCQKIPWTRAHLYEDELPAKKGSKWIHAMS
jgi:cyclopropane-fatty-acyl-phospholipid synthase